MTLKKKIEIRMDELQDNGFDVLRDPRYGHGATRIKNRDSGKEFVIPDHVMQFFTQFDRATLSLNADVDLLLEVEWDKP